jgi:hypothetical protein
MGGITQSALAAQLYSMGRMVVSLQLYAKLVGSTEVGRVSIKSQQNFLNNLLLICNDHTKRALAGVNRMAAPSKLSGAQRDRVRKEHLDCIVQVIQYTKRASRVLKLPNMDLPCVHDSTVTVIAEELHIFVKKVYHPLEKHEWDILKFGMNSYYGPLQS